MLIGLPNPADALERIEDVDVESRCKLANFANQRLPDLAVSAHVGIWSDDYPGAPDQRDLSAPDRRRSSTKPRLIQVVLGAIEQDQSPSAIPKEAPDNASCRAPLATCILLRRA